MLVESKDVDTFGEPGIRGSSGSQAYYLNVLAFAGNDSQ